MRSTRGALFALAALGGYFVWRNRFAIQKQLESWGVATPTLGGNFSERARSVFAKVRGQGKGVAEEGKDILESADRNVASNY